MRPLPGLQFGLRRRIAAAFGLVALGVSVVLAVTTYTLTSSYLLSQRYDTVERQAVLNAQTVRDVLLTRQPAIAALLERLDTTGGETSSSIVVNQGLWYDNQFEPGYQTLPESFLEAATDGRAVRQRIELEEGGKAVAVALPLETTGGVYVEVFSMRELDRTLRTLAVTFAGTTTATTLLGLLLGGWASRRSLQPLRAVTATAGRFAAGDLDARLDVRRDPDLRPLADTFNDTASRLQRRVEGDARFAANVSHELRTPLTTMVNAVEVLQGRAGQLDQESREVLDLLAGDVHRFARMVEDLLEISRLDADVANLRWEPVRIASLVRVVADGRAGRPVTEYADGAGDLVCLVDKRRLERVVDNLVANAQAHGRGVIRVVVAPHSSMARIVVEDHGPGVATGEETSIFERFSRGRGHATGENEGVGLGLALVREHIRLHDGRVWVESRSGGGARFVVELPVQRP